MTKLPLGLPDYDQRIRRAGVLSGKYVYAPEFLEFYKKIAGFQKTLNQVIVDSHDFSGESNFSASLRGALDLTALLPHFRNFLAVIEQHGPAALADSARQFSLLPSQSWTESLNAYWECAGRFDQQVGAFAQFFPRAFLQPYVEFLAARAVVPPMLVTTRVCPLCGSRPLLGVLRLEGDGGKRFLLCSFCCKEWEFRRIHCPTCGEESEEKLPVYVAEELPQIRVEACDTCKFYVRSIDLTKDGHAVPMVDDLAAIPLSLWAHEMGYTRLQPNLLGT
jgi:FdhE protein